MTDILLIDGALPLSVKLSIDLEAYCKSCKALRDLRLNHAPSDEAFSTHQLLKMALNEDIGLSGFNSGLQWLSIKSKMKQQFQRQHENPMVKEDIKQIFNNQSPPLAIETLDKYFIELLKNSMDAIIHQYLKDASKSPLLEMDIVWTVEKGNLSITLTDNGEGFPESYLIEFNKKILTEKYKLPPGPSLSQKHNYYFGGQGLGLSMTCDYILDGAVRKGACPPVHEYTVKKSSTSIYLLNDPLSHGAKIILTSPLKPFPIPMQIENDSEKPIELQSVKAIRPLPLVFFKKPASHVKCNSPDTTQTDLHSPVP